MNLLVSVRSARPLAASAQRCLMRIALGAIFAGAAATSAHAGVATLNEADLDAIFSQPPVLNGTKIDVRFNPTVTLDEPSLLTINTEDELTRLFGFGSSSPTIDLFFVDAINECGGEHLPPAIGCGQQADNHIAVESDFAAKQGSGGNPGLGAVLVAHEIGHNLGLTHEASASNLLNATLNGNWTLTQAQENQILGSKLVQTDQSGARFISITPFAVVPEPGTMLFASIGALWAVRLVRRRAIA